MGSKEHDWSTRANCLLLILHTTALYCTSFFFTLLSDIPLSRCVYVCVSACLDHSCFCWFMRRCNKSKRKQTTATHHLLSWGRLCEHTDSKETTQGVKITMPSQPSQPKHVSHCSIFPFVYIKRMKKEEK